MNTRFLLILSVLALLAVQARASTVVEVVGRVVGTYLNTGPWVAVRPGELVYMTYQVVDGGTIVPPGSSNCGFGLRDFALIPGTFHTTVHNVAMDAPLVAGSGDYLSPSCYFANNCPGSDVIMFESGARLAAQGTGTALYSMIFELHDSTGSAWNSSDMGQELAFHGASTFDYVEWNIGAPNLTSITLQFVSLNIHATGLATGACCMGDGGCAVTSSQICASGAWAADGTCGPSACPPSGACCFGDGTCDLMTQAACAVFPNALYEGDGTSCASVSCPQVSACCIGGACSLLNEQACVNSGGTWQAQTLGWLGTVAGCDQQPQYYHGVLANLPDATGGTTQQPVITPGVFTDSINIEDQAPVQRVELWLGIGLQRINDLRVRLTGPNGTTLDLVARIGSPVPCTTTPIGAGYSMFDSLILQDDAAETFYSHVLGAAPGSLVTGGRFKPAGCSGSPVLLNAPSPAGFGGISVNGAWTIELRDERPGVQEYLNAWGLSFNGGAPLSCAPTCGSADFNCDGDVATDADIEAFFACLAGNCPASPCNASADFNGDGDVATDADIEAFFRVLAGGTC
jgi:subtilisin-like proprotein convertase family protein